MKLVFRTATEALLHGDLHTGSIMVTGTDTRVIDPEWAFHGPMGFDVGAVLGNLLLAYCSQRGHARGGEERSAYAAWVLETFCAVWERFAATFLELWRADGDELLPAALFGSPREADRFRMRRLDAIFEDSMGFAACKMIRRILGISHVEDLEAIPDAALRAECEAHALRLARELLVNRRRYRNVSEVAAMARAAASAA